ncbi:rhodanese-like domain-containing protein [Radiobacillus sp. PE A8.2]|uniref:rhodanese-like domain-containing protein n=1 Tax=Radiobacillus sp. PE A8.2 TaxID=3380349 RepID=UPI00388F43B7
MKQYAAIEVQKLVEADKAQHIIDVREVDEVETGKIPGAIHIPLGLLEFRMHELDKSKEYILVCRSGGRSGRAGQLLESHGFNVINMDGGMLAWQGKIE